MLLGEKRALGLEIARDGIRMASASGAKSGIRLNSYAAAQFPAETLRLSFREPNILDAAAFVAAVRGTYLKLLEKGVRVSVSLPDAVGRVLLVDLDSRFKSKDEGVEIIRWKLRKSGSMDIEKNHLDYQVLRENETGGVNVLVSLVGKGVISQYEDLLVEAGIEPNRIDFTSFNLYRLFSRRLEMARNAIFTSVYDQLVTVMIFHDGILSFFRSKELHAAAAPEKLFQEISSSLLVYREKNPTFEVEACYCFAESGRWKELQPVVTEAARLEPKLLAAEETLVSGSGVIASSTAFSVAACVGAALRNL